MSLESLRKNIGTEKKIIEQLFNLQHQIETARNESEKKFLMKTADSLFNQLKIINNSFPKLLNSISLFKRIDGKKPEESKVKGLVKVQFKSTQKDKENVEVAIGKEERGKFLKELSLSESSLKRIKKLSEKKDEKKEGYAEFKKSGTFARTSNKFFSNFSHSLIQKKYFENLEKDLRKANLPYLLTTYVSMGFFSTLIALILGVFMALGLILFYGVAGLQYSFVVIILPLFAFIAFYFYPSAEKKGIEAKINHELPFVAIHMSAIAGSGIEPSKIFKIIAVSEEYPSTKKEIKKILNQVNIYGYDIVTAVKNVAKRTPSKKFSELLSGLASTISEGGSLTEFFDKRAETLLFEYKVDKEKSTKVAETFMDIYISIMIMAPMMMMLLLILITMTGISVGLSMNAMTFVVILLIALVNVMALVFLHIKQPTY